MLRLTKLADYAVVMLCEISHASDVRTTPQLAQATGVPEPTVAKVLKALAGAGLVASQRGARGGYRLRRDLASISVADVIAAIDGPIALTACVDGSAQDCSVSWRCPLHGRWNSANAAVHAALSAICLTEMRPTNRAVKDPVPTSAE